MNHYQRLAGAAIAASILVLSFANPALAIAPPAPAGEVLTSYGTDCGVLTVTPSSPHLLENVAVSLTRAKPSTDLSLNIVLGVYKAGRWFPFIPEKDSTDGKIEIDSASPLKIPFTTDAGGAASATGTIGQLLGDVIISTSSPAILDLELTLLPNLWVVQCDAGVSFAQIRGARASLPGTLALDPTTPGSITGSGLPADSTLTGQLVEMGDYPDPGVAVWQAYAHSSPVVRQLEAKSDDAGAVASTTFFAGLEPGRYALGVVSLRGTLPNPTLYKAEYVLNVADDLSASLKLWADPTIAASLTSLSLAAHPGAQVAGSAALFTSSSLKPDTDWSLTVHSTPQVIAHGIVGVSGILTGSAALPTGLESGWHTLTFSSTDSFGVASDSMYWFKVGDAGELLQVSDTEPTTGEASVAMLAATGLNGMTTLALTGGLLALGLAVTAVSRRRTARP